MTTSVLSEPSRHTPRYLYIGWKSGVVVEPFYPILELQKAFHLMRCGWWVESIHLRVVWRWRWVESGAVCVMTPGTQMMPLLYASLSLDLGGLVWPMLTLKPTLEKELVTYGLMMSYVMEMSRI